MTLIYLPITSTKATPQVNAYRTINVQLPPLELKILFAILSCWTYRQWGSFGPVDNESFIILPISATPIKVVVVDMARNGIPLCMSTSGYAVGKFKVVGVRVDQSLSPLWGHWIAVCN